MAGWWLKRQPFTQLRVYTYKKGMQKTIQNIHRTLHNPLHQFDYLNVMQCMIFVLNPTQTLHWNRHKPYTETGQKTTLKRSKPYTETGTETCKTLHKIYTRKPTPQPYILFFEHESNEWHEREWIVRYERDEQKERSATPTSRRCTFPLKSGLGAHLGKTRSAPKKN